MPFAVDRQLYADVEAEPETVDLAIEICKVAGEVAEGQPQYRFAMAMVRATAAIIEQCAMPGQAGELLAATAEFMREKAAVHGVGTQ